MEQSVRRYDIAIAGASFAGLALAIACGQRHGGEARIAIIDPALAREPRRDDRAFAIWRGAQTVLDNLGVWDRLADVAQPMTAIEISDSARDDGVRPTRLMYDGPARDGAAVAHMVPSEALHAGLLDVARAVPGIDWIASSVEVLNLDARCAGLTLGDGTRVEAALCVAADGRMSKLREAAGIKTVGWDYQQMGLTCVVQASAPHGGTAIQHFLPGGPFALLPLRDNRFCVTWSVPTAVAQRLVALDDTAFVAVLDGVVGGRFGTLSLTGQRQAWPLDLRLARELTATRFCVIGDAAHGVHPVAGQGVNLAMRDVAALTDCVAERVRIGLPFGDAGALDAYARWRRFDTTMSASMYDALNRFFSVDSTVLRAVRGAGLGVVDGSETIKRWIMDEASGLSGDLPTLMQRANTDAAA